MKENDNRSFTTFTLKKNADKTETARSTTVRGALAVKVVKADRQAYSRRKQLIIR